MISHLILLSLLYWCYENECHLRYGQYWILPYVIFPKGLRGWGAGSITWVLMGCLNLLDGVDSSQLGSQGKSPSFRIENSI
jgi:hypothetical protein